MSKIYTPKTDITILDLTKLPKHKIYLSPNSDGGEIGWQDKIKLLFDEDDYVIFDSSTDMIDGHDQISWELYAMEICDVVIINSSNLSDLQLISFGLHAESDKIIMYYCDDNDSLNGVAEHYGITSFGDVVELADWAKNYCEI